MPGTDTDLMQRTEGGVTVTLHWWDGENGLADPQVYITVTDGEDTCQANINPEEALEAYWHPFCYLQREN